MAKAWPSSVVKITAVQLETDGKVQGSAADHSGLLALGVAQKVADARNEKC